ncbi:prepilin peptidase [Luedemannella helvata]|uniref:A24 family peptidase n=1 Tax=Luedemannella helvata TaxID=349315 RepID=A0ABP4X8T4_9ACTN
MHPASMIVLLVVITLLGLAVGSFLNVVIHRVPRGESVVSPPSRCPACAAPIRPWHNVPVVSWLALRGRCAGCGTRISVRYPLVELATGGVFAALAVRLAATDQLGAVPAMAYFAALGIALAMIDIDVRRLPNALVLPSYPVVALLLVAASAVHGDWSALGRAGLGAAALFAFFLAVALLYPGGMGMGDVKLAGLLGGVLAYLSWSTVIIGTFTGFLLGALLGVAVMLVRRGERRTAVPFGPFMIAGGLLAVFAAAPLADLYLSMLSA